MKVLLLNAGSSSLKCTLMESARRQVLASSLTDWAGSMTHYQYSRADHTERVEEEAPWKGHSEAVRRVLHDMMHASEVRKAVCVGLDCLGLEIDPSANAECKPDADVATRSSRGRIFVIATREDVTMLGEVLSVLADARRESQSPIGHIS